MDRQSRRRTAAAAALLPLSSLSAWSRSVGSAGGAGADGADARGQRSDEPRGSAKQLCPVERSDAQEAVRAGAERVDRGARDRSRWRARRQVARRQEDVWREEVLALAA